MIAHRFSNVFGEPHQLVCIFFKILNMHKFELKKNWKKLKNFQFLVFYELFKKTKSWTPYTYKPLPPKAITSLRFSRISRKCPLRLFYFCRWCSGKRNVGRRKCRSLIRSRLGVTGSWIMRTFREWFFFVSEIIVTWCWARIDTLFRTFYTRFHTFLHVFTRFWN